MLKMYFFCRGFIHNEESDPKEWVSTCNSHIFLNEDKTCCSGAKFVYAVGTRLIKIKLVADAVEALTGAYLCTKREIAALCFMKWLGMDVNINFEMLDDRPLLFCNIAYFLPCKWV